jgi:hypothetical protein
MAKYNLLNFTTWVHRGGGWACQAASANQRSEEVYHFLL